MLFLLLHVVGNAAFLLLVRVGRGARFDYPTVGLTNYATAAVLAALGLVASGLDGVELVRSVAYVNSKGEEWTTSVEDILMHVVLHSAYHRGQVAYVLRAGGATPAYTDYAHCVRNGLVD